MTLFQFLGELANSPTRQLRFRQRPVEMARESGLPDSIADVVASRDPARLRELLAQGTGSSMIYSSETAFVYSPETAYIYSPETV